MMRPSRAPAEHAIAEREEPILTAQRVRVGGAPPVRTCERREQHEQRRARLMEVGHQAVDDCEAMPRTDEQLRAPTPGAGDIAVAGARLEDSDDGGADGDDSSAGTASALDRSDGRGRQRVLLLVHRVSLEPLAADG